MKKDHVSHINKTLIPAIGLSALCGGAVAVLIFLFKLISGKVIELSSHLFDLARGNIAYLPVIVCGAALLGLLASLLLYIEPNSRGGGIPTAVAIVRGLFEFRWLRSILMIFPSAMITYLCGIPLGNEGPSVQMGSALGRGTVSLFGKKALPFDRYIMTGGACAGFAAATGAPLSGILFALEEAQRRYTPMLFVTSSVSVTASVIVSFVLERLTGVSATLFDFGTFTALPLSSIWFAIVPGIVCGLVALLFTRLYRSVGKLISVKLARVPLGVRISVFFGISALIGYFVVSATGSGHHLVHDIMESHLTWKITLLALITRALLLMFANNAGVTGGLFLPTLAIGALVGSLTAKAFIACGLISAEHYALAVGLGMIAYMSAASRTPLMAIAFGAEAMLGVSALLPTVICALTAYLVIEFSGEVAFSDTVIEKKVSAERRGKTCRIVESFIEVQKNSFAVGKELRDLLMPPGFVVLSVRRKAEGSFSAHVSVGDKIHVRYQTFDGEDTSRKLEDIFGDQSETFDNAFRGSPNHNIPD